MAKEPQSFSITDWVKEETKKSDTNFSSLVDDFLKSYLEGGQSREAALNVQINHLDEEIADHRKEIERMERQRDQLEAMLQSNREQLEEMLDECEEKYGRAGLPPLEPDNPAIQNWAQKARVSPQRFVTALERRIE